MDSHSPFACLLVGQPTPRRRIKLGTFATLDQRTTFRCATAGMTGTETAGYLTHHMKTHRAMRPLCSATTRSG